MNKFSKLFCSILTLLFFLVAGVLSAGTSMKGKDFEIKIDGDKVIFILTRSGSAASVPGYFNSWNPKDEGSLMKKVDGKFQLEVPLSLITSKKPYEFKFFVDGQWDGGDNKKINFVKKGDGWEISESAPAAVAAPAGGSNVGSAITFKGVLFTRFPIAMNTYSAAWNTVGDDHFYVNSPSSIFDLEMEFKIKEKVRGFARMRVNNYIANRYWLLDEALFEFTDDKFTMLLFSKHRDKRMNFEDPFGILNQFNMSYTKSIFFYGHNNSGLYDFGRYHSGLFINLPNLIDGKLIIARRIDNSHEIFTDDIIALRLTPLKS